MALVTKVILIICLVTKIIDWNQKLKNTWVQIEISRVQPCDWRPFAFNTAVDRVYIRLRQSRVSTLVKLEPPGF